MYTLVQIEWTEKLSTVTSEYRIIAARVTADDKEKFETWVNSAKVGEHLIVNDGNNIIFKVS